MLYIISDDKKHNIKKSLDKGKERALIIIYKKYFPKLVLSILIKLSNRILQKIKFEQVIY